MRSFAPAILRQIERYAGKRQQNDLNDLEEMNQ
jgi:hypothetical protein